MKLPFMKFYTADWIQDTRILTLEERGAWLDILCLLWNSKPRGSKTMTLADWGQYLGVESQKTGEILKSLNRKEIGNVTFGNDDITVMSRRITKEEKRRISDLEKVRRYRSNQIVTEMLPKTYQEKLDTRSQKLYTRDKTNPLPGGESFDVLASFEKVWKFYPRPLGKKAAFAHFKKSIESKDDLKRIAAALDNYIAHIEAKKVEEKFIQHGSTWFNNWEDWENYNGEKK